MKTEKCKMVYVAKVIVEGQDDKDHVVMMFDDMIMKVTDGVLMFQKRVASVCGSHKFNIDSSDTVY